MVRIQESDPQPRKCGIRPYKNVPLRNCREPWLTIGLALIRFLRVALCPLWVSSELKRGHE